MEVEELEHSCRILIENTREHESNVKRMSNLYEQKKHEHNKLQDSNKTDNTMYMALVKQLNSLEDDVKKFDTDIGSAKVDCDDLIKKELRLMSTIEKKKLQYNDYKNQKVENESRIRKLEKELDELHEDIANIQNEMEDIVKEAEVYKKDAVDHEKKKGELEKKRDTLRKDHARMMEGNVKISVEIQKLSREIELLEECHKEGLEENKHKSELLAELKNRQNNQNSNLVQLGKNLKRIKANVTSLSDSIDDYKVVSADIIKVYEHFEKIVWKIKQLKDNPEEMEAAKKLVVNLKEQISELNNQMLIAQQENVMLEQETRILKELKGKLGKELDNLKSQKKKNEVLNNYMLQDNVKNKDEYLDLIYEEMNTLRSLRIEREVVDLHTKEKVLDIVKLIKEEQENRKEMIAHQTMQDDDKLAESGSGSRNSLDDAKKLSVDNSLFLGNDSEMSNNNKAFKQNNILAYVSNQPNMTEVRRTTDMGMRNSNSMKTYEFTQNLYDNPVMASSRNTSIDRVSFNHLYKREDYHELSELQVNWKNIIKDLMRLISYFLKSSSVMANNISSVITKSLKTNVNFQKLRSSIVK